MKWKFWLTLDSMIADSLMVRGVLYAYPFFLRIPFRFLDVMQLGVTLSVLLPFLAYSYWHPAVSFRIHLMFLAGLMTDSVCGLIFTGAPAENVNLRSKIYIYLWLTLALNLLVTFLTGGLSAVSHSSCP